MVATVTPQQPSIRCWRGCSISQHKICDVQGFLLYRSTARACNTVNCLSCWAWCSCSSSSRSTTSSTSLCCACFLPFVSFSLLVTSAFGLPGSRSSAGEADREHFWLLERCSVADELC